MSESTAAAADASGKLPESLENEPLKADEAKSHEHKYQEPKSSREDRKNEEPPVVAAASEAVAETSGTNPQPEAEAPKLANEFPSDQSSPEQTSAGPVSADAVSRAMEPPPSEPVAAVTADMGKKESDIAATTAAAWASWRRIRESDPKAQAPSAKPSRDEDEAEEESSPRDAAAMAVAAGAEKAPEDIPPGAESESGEIASIVDSVLADMRPKIVAEISRKLGKKK